jgi:hypothetical protein
MKNFARFDFALRWFNPKLRGAIEYTRISKGGVGLGNG